MSEYKKRQVKLPTEVWDRLDEMVEDMGGTVTADFFVLESLRPILARQNGPVAVDDGNGPDV